MRAILQCVDGEVYDVTSYAAKHPGEGIRGVYIRSYNGKDCSDEFETMHMTDEPHAILHRAREGGCDEATGVRYICPFVFKRRIPRELVRLEREETSAARLSDADPGAEILVAMAPVRERGFELVRKQADGSVATWAIVPGEGAGWSADAGGDAYEGTYPEEVLRALRRAIRTSEGD